MKQLLFAGLAVCVCLAGAASGQQGTTQATAIPAEWRGKITDTAQLAIETNSWGTLQWVCNEKLMPGSLQTVGLANILPGKQNPVHFHPNCEEVLYVLSGQGIHSYNGRTVELRAGTTIRIPPKVKHNLVNTGTEPLRTLVSFSTGDRQTVWLDQQPAK